jgi:molybdenum cofactor cytidylyltransferase
MTKARIVGVILAAGRSERFGPPKQLLPLGNTTLLGHVVHNANGSILDKVVVVLGRSAAEIEESLDFGRAIVVDNAAYPSGCASSLLAGLDAAGDCAALMLLLGDQPGVGGGVIDLVSRDWLANRSWAAVTSYRGRLGHPFVFARSAFDDLRGLHGDKAVWKLIEAHPQRVRRVEVDRELPPDIDTPEDYRRLVAGWPPLPAAAPSKQA